MLFDPYAYDLTTSAGPSPLPGAGLQAPAAAGASLADALLEVPQEAQDVLWQGLVQAVDGALDLWDRTPPARRSAPPFNIQHAGKLHFNPADLRAQTLEGWHRLVGIELRLAAQMLEALILGESEVYRALLAEQCARVGQLYGELKRRAGARFALLILRWEARLLRYRASPVLAPLIYD